MTNHKQAAIEAGAKAWWEARATLNPEYDTWDNAGRLGLGDTKCTPQHNIKTR